MRTLSRLLLAVALLCLLAVDPVAAGTSEKHYIVTCATTVTPIFVATPNRISFIIYNNSAAIVFIGSGNPATLTTGNGLLVAVSGAYQSNNSEYTGPMGCIVASGTSEIRVQEILR